MLISVGSDHAGYNLKTKMIPFIIGLGHEVEDCGCQSTEPVFFPDIAKKVCTPLLKGKAEKAIMFCGTGVGASIACNKIRGIRASVIHDVQIAHQAVEHDHVQVMCIGEKIVGEWLAEDLIKVFLSAKGDTDERTCEVLRKLEEMEKSF